jgi:hypothetical protein
MVFDPPPIEPARDGKRSTRIAAYYSGSATPK